MKGTDIFKRTIHTYLVKRAASDELFAQSFANSDKSVGECVVYILNQVHKSGCNGFTDEEIFGMAVEYYCTDKIEVGKPINARIAVNHVVQLTSEEKEEARQEAMQRVQDEAYKKMTQPTKRAKKIALNPQPSLFDF
jgi:hypothetical protein